ncbi:MAG: AAA family ATPase [Oscillatoriales cyanobacterium C42_A2020_001]|nr:AAA family ATPase [Leptolyngbyaceae cyanobacterium C42_A2020_001]
MSELLEQGIEALNAENYTAAILLFTHLIDTDQEPVDAYVWRAWSYYCQQEYEQTILDSTKSINLQLSWFAYWVRGKAYQEIGDLQAALSDFNRSIDIETTSSNYWSRGRIYEQLGELQLALDDYTSSINLSPSDPTNYISRAFLWEKAGYFDQAVDDYTTALELDPKNADSLFFRACAYQELGMDAEALADLIKLREIDPERDNLDEQIQVIQVRLGEQIQPVTAQNNELEETENLETLLSKLDQLTGLPNVKAEVRKLVNLVRVQQLRRERGLATPPLSLHLVFTGNPGTGKITVARLISQIYKALGLLSKGHVVEVDRSGLVAGFVGQTALKVKDVVTSAKGGILFIDEAYTLVSGVSNGSDFGREAIDTLLKAMEDHRDDFVVIVAGYPEQMSAFLSSNPGLQSRFNKHIAFDDYTINELSEILQNLCASSGYFLNEAAVHYATELLQDLVNQDPVAFGNARGVRNLFEQAIAAQASRVIEIKHPSEVDLCTLDATDFVNTPLVFAVA